MKILYFYSEVMGYTLAVIKELVKTYNAEVHVVNWDHKRKASFELTPIQGVIYYKRSQLNLNQLIDLTDQLNPSLVYISGRMDNDYLKCALHARKKNIPTISGFDNQWHGNYKNWISSLLSPFLYKRYFDYLWVSGVFQYEYARRLGYPKSKILWNVYAAETSLFESISKRNSIKKQFVFAGRLTNVKGLDLLVKAFLETNAKAPDWSLLIIGSGELSTIIPIHSSIEYVSFLQPQEFSEKIKDGGVFVLPSRHEPWGVVIHEFAAAAFPIICSDICGAATAFVRNNYNGYIFEKNNLAQLQKCMVGITQLSEKELNEMSGRSSELSKSINPLISASSLISILK